MTSLEEITVHDAKISSCFQLPAQNTWMSGFVSKRDYELFSLRRHTGLFASHCDPFPNRPVGRQVDQAYFGGVLFPYYGHFIIESLSFLPNIPKNNAKIVFMTLNNTVTGWQKEFFQDVGLASRIVITEKDSLLSVGSLIRVDQTTVVCSNISRRFIKHVQGLYPSTPNKGRRLYLSRKNCKNATVENEHLLEEELIKLGFEVVVAEQYPIREQVRLYNEAEVIVAVEGSALHTLVFSSTPKTVLVLARRKKIDVNFTRQFAVQPEIQAVELYCMKQYADTFKDASEIDIEAAVGAIQGEMDRLARK